MVVVSPKSTEAAKFRASEARLGGEYAYRGSYFSRADLEPMAGKDRPFEERSFAIGMTDFTQGVPESARGMLREMTERDATIANLFFRTIMEEVPGMAMVEGVLQQDMFERLRELQSFRDYEARVIASAEASAEARLKSKTEAAAAEARAGDLIRFFGLRGDTLSEHAFAQIRECKDVGKLGYWLERAYTGTTAEEIFPEPGR